MKETHTFAMKQLQAKIPFSGPVVLAIIDGFGISSQRTGNAVQLARMPHWKKLLRTYPHIQLEASGQAVGLVKQQDGNSEAGHMNIGAGRVVEQDPVRINRTIRDGRFYKNPAFKQAIHHAKQHQSAIHLMGMLGNRESAHAYPDHLFALLTLCHTAGIQKVYVHLFTDGRDSPPHAAITLVHRLHKHMFPEQKIATIMGRYYGMERAKRWAVTEQAYHALVLGRGCGCVATAEEAISQAYNRGETDEFIQPTLIAGGARIANNDAIIFFNLRSDRARQLTKTFVQKNFTRLNAHSFSRKKILKNTLFVSMTDFGPDLDSVLSAFPSSELRQTLPTVLSPLRQLYIAESEKYAHVTYFINGGYADPVNGEVRIKVESPHMAHYDLTPEMSGSQITDIILQYIQERSFDFFCVNYANADMVGHTGNLPAAIHAVEEIDTELGRLYASVKKNHGLLIVTADHGNAEEMINVKTGEADTEHSTNPVPLLIANRHVHFRRKTGVLGDIAPTMLSLLGMDIPQEMTGKVLI